MDLIRCDFEPATFLFISEEVAPLVYYSHFIAIFAALAIALLVFINNPRQLISQLFLLFSAIFSIWAFLDVILWATNDPGVVIFSWSLQVLAEPILYATAFYLFYVFIFKSIPSFTFNSIIFILFLPLILLLPTNLNLENVYLSFCETDEGPLALYYTYFMMISFIIMTLFFGFKKIPSLSKNTRKSSRIFIFGLIIFLLSFSVANIVSSFTDNWTLSQYGLFGMPVFSLLIAYSIVQFKTFKIEIAGAQVLVVVLLALVASLLLVRSELIFPITVLTLVFTAAAGILLIRSVKKEFEQRLELEKLTQKLERANLRLKELDKLKSEFVSIASHQLRSPITAIRGYASLLLEGSYGDIPAKATEALERIEHSSKLMATSIEDYLNVSRIESGNMKYNLSDFNIKDEVEHLTDDLRTDAIKKGLVLLFKSDLRSRGVIHADLGKTVQIVQNLITNSIKYTEEGSIKVVVRDDINKKKISVDIIDTGIGMSDKTLHSIFQKFERADNANSVNVRGTGLGLYVAKMMAEAMDGTISAYSDGDGKGSRFTFEMPLAM